MQTTTKELAEACGMSVGTLYYYIKSKNDFPQMFCEIHNSDLDIMEKEIHKEMLVNTLENTLRKAVKQYLYWIDRRNKLIMFWYDTVRYLSQDQLRAITHAEFRAIGYFEEILEKGKKEGCFKFRDLRVTAYSIELLCHEWILKATVYAGPVFTRRVFQTCARIWPWRWPAEYIKHQKSKPVSFNRPDSFSLAPCYPANKADWIRVPLFCSDRSCYLRHTQTFQPAF